MISRNQIEIINNRRTQIISNIKNEDIGLYLFLIQEFSKGDIRDNHPFQIVFRSYYGLERSGLTDHWKKEYFSLLESCRNRQLDKSEIKSLARALYDIRNHRDLNTFQFSFITKLLNMVDGEKWPIFDKNVASVFQQSGHENPMNATGTFDSSFLKAWAYYKMMRKSFEVIRNENLLHPTIAEFQRHFHTELEKTQRSIPVIRILDFIFWSYGKIIVSRK
ncbi:MAG TPA: hypothetical protein VN944_10665 [Nitrospiria bacterium]|nr:hypothetical protein [Nitrospiria bacterium]